MRSSEEEFNSSAETVLSDNESSNLSTFCTIRTERKQKKTTPNHLSNLNFCTLRNQRDKSSNDNAYCVPYNQLKDTLSDDNSFDVDNDNLIDLDDSIRPEVEAINSLLIDKYEGDLLSNSPPDLSDWKPKASQSTNNTLDKTDRKQSLKELKRLSSYCTLRPEQRRKYILRTISTLRNVNKISDETNDALNLLHELNSFDIGDEASSSLSDIAACFSDPEKVEDCLLELDAYLDEIDRNYLYSDGMASEKENNFPHDKIVSVQQCKANGNNHNVKTKTSQEDCEKIEEIITTTAGENHNCGYSEFLNRFSDCDNATSVTDDSNCWMNNVLLDAHEDSCDEHYDRLSDVMNFNSKNIVDTDDGAIARGHSYRNTINVANSSSSTFPRSSQKTKDSNKAAKRHSSWRRNSMRKTRPIEIPEQSTSQGTISTADAVNYSTTPRRMTLPHLRKSDDTVLLIPSIEPTDRTTIPSRDAITLESVIKPNEPSNPNLENELNDNRETIASRTLGDQFLNTLTQSTSDVTDLDSSFDFGCPETHFGIEENAQIRPRQLGRRAEGRNRVVSITTETNSHGNQLIIVNHDRPTSAPARVAQRPEQYVASEPSSVVSSRNASPVSIISSSASSSTASATDNTERPPPPPQRSSQTTDPENLIDEQEDNEKSKVWPHCFSRILAASCCTLGLFNISRFSILSIYFGANFIVQFLILSIVFGIPMLWLQMSLGARIKGGPISMWRVSPICKGVGISLLLVQAFVALYSAVSIGWVLVYFRDSFATQSGRYRWQEPFLLFRGYRVNESVKLEETVADYFSGVVLQRFQLGPGGRPDSNGIGAVRFQVAFNMAVLWLFVFVVLCKGLRSYGKIVLGLMVLPLIGLTTLCAKMLSMVYINSLQSIFPATDWQDFFINSQSWLSAAQEVFLTWALFGASIISIFSKTTHLQEKKTTLRRDALIVVLITLVGLMLAAVLGNACVQILSDYGYYYFPGSYENMNSYVFLLPSSSPLPSQLIAIPSKWLPRYSTVLGENFRRTGMNPNRESGYQPLRLVTELFPSALAAATQENISAGWSVLGFLLFLIFGLAQLCAMWKPIAGSLGNSTSSILLSCVTGLLLGIPLATECGINIIHFFDHMIGGSWFVLLLWVGQIFAIFLVRGRPISGDILVNDLRLTQTLSAFVALSWNVLLPIGMMTLCILEYRQSNSRDLYQWRGKTYYAMWTRKVGGFMQVGFLLLVPLTSIIQIYRYLSSGPPDILDRIQLLYRPSLRRPSTTQNRYTENRTDRPNPNNSIPAVITIESRTTTEDAPPKYTPPPSYTTATGARIAKMLRNSIRRSVRRIIGEPSSRQRPGIQHTLNSLNNFDECLPPAYSTVRRDAHSTSHNETEHRTLHNIQTNDNHTIDSHRQIQTTELTNRSQTLTARDVAQLLRPSDLQYQRAASLGAYVEQDQILRNSLQKELSRSVENLVLNAAPVGESSIIDLNHYNDDRNTSVI